MAKKKIEVVFLPGSLDDFEGTQQELDEFIEELQQLAEEMYEQALIEEEPTYQLDELDESNLSLNTPRILH